MNVVLGELKEQTIYTCTIVSGDYTHQRSFKSLEEFDQFKRSLWEKWEALQVCDTAKKFPIGSKAIYLNCGEIKNCEIKSYDLILSPHGGGHPSKAVTIEFAQGRKGRMTIVLDNFGKSHRLMHSLNELFEVPQC